MPFGNRLLGLAHLKLRMIWDQRVACSLLPGRISERADGNHSCSCSRGNAPIQHGERRYSRFREPKQVTCLEKGEAATVQVDAKMADLDQCPLCGLRTASERSTQMHLRSDHKRKESEISELLGRAKAGSLGCDPAAKLLRKVIKAPPPAIQPKTKSMIP